MVKRLFFLASKTYLREAGVEDGVDLGFLGDFEVCFGCYECSGECYGGAIGSVLRLDGLLLIGDGRLYS